MLMLGSRRADTSRACFIAAGLTLLGPFETVLQYSDTKLISPIKQGKHYQMLSKNKDNCSHHRWLVPIKQGSFVTVILSTASVALSGECLSI